MPIKALRAHPENPRLFLFREKPIVLLTSAEHYGAVLNRAFDTIRYLDTLAAGRFNLTRIFSGIYREPKGAFNIDRNTLAPEEEDFICPWRKTPEGYDLTQWDQAYFTRLKAFLQAASERGIVVEYVFFCPFYNDTMWELSPLHPGNHVGGTVGKTKDKNDVWSLSRHQGALAVQEALIRKVTAELAGFDNLYYEVCNEPYIKDLPQDWHDHMARTIREAESQLPEASRHLISWNVANDTKKVSHPAPEYGLLNFHYANPPRAVTDNLGLGLPIGDNETGFRGQGNGNYRREAWEFLLAGGALFNHLDYSFAAGHEDGSFAYPPTQPGGGNAKLREQFTFLGDFLRGFDPVPLRPAQDLIAGGVPDQARAWLLAEPGKQYALYLTAGPASTLLLRVPDGRYRVEWFKPTGGKRLETRAIEAAGGTVALPTPPPDPDLALKMTREA